MFSAPYGPLFLWIGRGISSITGENIVEAVLFHRLVVLVGVGLIVWATPRLARRCGVALQVLEALLDCVLM